MSELLANVAQTFLAAPCAAGDTTITVASGVGFPPSGNFRIVIDTEILLVTNVSGTTWTVSRAVEPFSGVQTATAHSNGSLVTSVLTAGALTAFVGSSSGIATGTAANKPAAGIVGRLYATTDTYTLWMDTGSAWVAIGVAPGDILPRGAVARPGTVLADGSSYSTTGIYADLFAAYGYTYGGSGANFNVLDLRDRAPIGASPGSLSGNRPTARTLGQSGGEEAHTLTAGELAVHAHSIAQLLFQDSVSDSAGIPYVGQGICLSGQTQSSAISGNTDQAGSSVAHNNMQPFAVCNWVVKL